MNKKLSKVKNYLKFILFSEIINKSFFLYNCLISQYVLFICHYQLSYFSLKYLRATNTLLFIFSSNMNPHFRGFFCGTKHFVIVR